MLRAAVARADLSDLELYSILNAHVPLHPSVYAQALERWSQAPFWQAQLEAAQAGATPHACTQQLAQHAAWRNRALALEARALMHLKDAVQWNTWQAVTANFPRDPVRMRWLRHLGKALNQCPNAQDYAVADPFGALLNAAGGLAPDDVAGVLGPDAGWRTVAAKPAVSMIVEPFAPAVPTDKSVVWSGAAPDALITYPNPSAGRWHLTNVDPGTWYVYTLQGALVGTGHLQGSGDVVDGTAWPSGRARSAPSTNKSRGVDPTLADQTSIITGVSRCCLKVCRNAAPDAPSTTRWSHERVTFMRLPGTT